MKPVSVVLIALASAVAGGVVGLLLGGVAGGIAGGAGGQFIGLRAGICKSSEVAQAQNLLAAEQSAQLTEQTYEQLRATVGNGNELLETDKDCQTTLQEFGELNKN